MRGLEFLLPIIFIVLIPLSCEENISPIPLDVTLAPTPTEPVIIESTEQQDILSPITQPEPQIIFEPIVLTGSGDRKTPPFTVTTEEWIIDWSYTTGEPEWAMFSFYIYPRGETLFNVESCLFPSDTSGTTYSYAGVGEYYVEVSAANINDWEIVIRPPD